MMKLHSITNAWFSLKAKNYAVEVLHKMTRAVRDFGRKSMQFSAAAISVFLFNLMQSAIACSPSDDWRPATTQSAFRDVEVVVHARVKSQIFKEASVEGQIEVIRVFKGAFSGETVLTADSGACGIGKFNVGEEYVFFFPKKERYFVSHLVQPWHVPTQQILHELRTPQK
jgi:hypothetical protein